MENSLMPNLKSTIVIFMSDSFIFTEKNIGGIDQIGTSTHDEYLNTSKNIIHHQWKFMGI